MAIKRSKKKELIDTCEYSLPEYQDCLKKLFLINRLTRFFGDTVAFVKKVPCESLVDVGCGDGRFIKALKSRFPNISMRGTEISSDALQNSPQCDVQFECRHTLEENWADIVMATLVCHHLQDSELITF